MNARLRRHKRTRVRARAQGCHSPSSGTTHAARSTLRSIIERWERAGAVPRDEQDRLEDGLRRVEDAVRKAEESQRRKSSPEALRRARGTVEQIRASITALEGQLAKARERGDDAAQRQAQEAIDARRSWLEEAERTLAELSG